MIYSYTARNRRMNKIELTRFIIDFCHNTNMTYSFT